MDPQSHWSKRFESTLPSRHFTSRRLHLLASFFSSQAIETFLKRFPTAPITIFLKMPSNYRHAPAYRSYLTQNNGLRPSGLPEFETDGVSD
jgi:hypothetical protein